MYYHYDVFYMWLPLKNIQKFQLKQNAGVWGPLCLSLKQHVTTLLYKLYYFQVQFKVLTLIFKGLHGMGLIYFRDQFFPLYLPVPTSPSEKGILQVPSAEELYMARVQEVGFFYHGIHPVEN